MTHKKLKIAFIILCVLFIRLPAYSVTVSSWTYFKDIYVSALSVNIELSAADINFEDILAPLGHNITILGNGRYLVGQSTNTGLFLTSKDMILGNIGFKDFKKIGINANNSSVTFNNQINFSNNFVIFTSASVFQNYDYIAPISAKTSTLAFIDSNSNFTNNARISFTYNTASNIVNINVKGGVIYSTGAAFISFERSTITFANNFNITFSSNTIENKMNVLMLGGAIYAEQSSISFANSSMTFTKNGSLKLVNNQVNPATYTYTAPPPIGPMPLPFKVTFDAPIFETDEDFNFQFSGGAMFVSYSTMTAQNSAVEFSSNASYNSAGALLAQNSKIVFDRSSVNFSYNEAYKNNGGAIVVSDSAIDFNASTVSFIGNSAGVYGGGLFTLLSKADFNNAQIYAFDNRANYGGTMFFSGSQASFTNTTAAFINFSTDIFSEYGGAIGLYDSKVIFRYSSITFSSNIAMGNGGAFYAEENSLVKWTSASVSFSFNRAKTMSGGAIYLYKASMIFDNSAAQFNNNQSAWNGGAIYASGGSIIEFNNSTINFSNNSASAKGGAISLDNSKLIINNSKFLFDSNMSEISSNDFHINNNSQLILMGQNADIGASVYVENKSKIESYADTAAFKTIDIKIGSQYIMADKNKTQITSASFVNIEGILGLGVNLNNLKADQIKTADMAAGNYSSLVLTGDNAFNASGTVRIIEITSASSVGLFGIFENRDSIILDSNGGKINYQIIVSSNPSNPYHKYVDLKILGVSKLSDINGLSSNQSIIAGILDKVNLITNPEMNDMGKPIFDALFNSNEADVKKALYNLSGEFLSDILSANLIKNNITGLYPNIKKRQRANAIWTQYSLQSTNYDNDYGDEKAYLSGFQAGFNLLGKERAAIGLYGFYENGDIKQSSSKANVKDIGGGLYYGYLMDELNIKGHISAGFQTYNSRRYIDILGLTPSAEFESKSLSAGIDAQFILKSELFDLKPFMDLQYAVRTNDKFTEEQGQAANMIVDKQKFSKLILSFGAGLENDKNEKFNWHAKAYLGHIFIGANPKYQMSYVSAPEYGNFNIDAHKTSDTFVNISIGAKYNFTEQMSVYANFDISPMPGLLDLYANIGLRYSFGPIIKSEGKGGQEDEQKAEAFSEQEKQKTPPQITAAAMSEQKPQFNEATIQEVMNIAQSKEISNRQIEQADGYLKTIFRLTGNVFQEGRFKLSDSGKQIIANLVSTINQYNYNMIIVEGHTEYIENRRNLSTNRAKAVYNALVENGIPPSKITFIGKGPNEPLIKNNKPASRIKNRRTDIVVK
ncbi:MAG: autotransporter domain-containing protein [Elusimicrobiota bacterium]|jgi:predicted outer membrane repeat protein|nr:autotransporter domain-containing protein [Elusimicrobiota bacterium]